MKSGVKKMGIREIKDGRPYYSLITLIFLSPDFLNDV